VLKKLGIFNPDKKTQLQFHFSVERLVHDAAGHRISTYSPTSCPPSPGGPNTSSPRGSTQLVPGCEVVVPATEDVVGCRPMAASRAWTASRMLAALPPLDDRGRSRSSVVLRTPRSKSHGIVNVRGRMLPSTTNDVDFST